MKRRCFEEEKKKPDATQVISDPLIGHLLTFVDIWHMLRCVQIVSKRYHSIIHDSRLGFEVLTVNPCGIPTSRTEYVVLLHRIGHRLKGVRAEYLTNVPYELILSEMCQNVNFIDARLSYIAPDRLCQIRQIQTYATKRFDKTGQSLSLWFNGRTTSSEKLDICTRGQYGPTLICSSLFVDEKHLQKSSIAPTSTQVLQNITTLALYHYSHSASEPYQNTVATLLGIGNLTFLQADAWWTDVIVFTTHQPRLEHVSLNFAFMPSLRNCTKLLESLEKYCPRLASIQLASVYVPPEALTILNRLPCLRRLDLNIVDKDYDNDYKELMTESKDASSDRNVDSEDDIDDDTDDTDDDDYRNPLDFRSLTRQLDMFSIDGDGFLPLSKLPPHVIHLDIKHSMFLSEQGRKFGKRFMDPKAVYPDCTKLSFGIIPDTPKHWRRVMKMFPSVKVWDYPKLPCRLLVDTLLDKATRSNIESLYLETPDQGAIDALDGSPIPADNRDAFPHLQRLFFAERPALNRLHDFLARLLLCIPSITYICVNGLYNSASVCDVERRLRYLRVVHPDLVIDHAS